MRNLATGHRELLNALLAITHHSDIYLCVLRTFQTAHGFLIGHLLSDKSTVVDGHNLIACQQTSTLGGAVLDDCLHMDGVLTNNKLDAHTRERTLQVVVGGLHIACTHVNRMRV